MKRICNYLVLPLMILVGALGGTKVFAEGWLTDTLLTIYSQNDILFTVPCGDNGSGAGGAGLLEGKDNKERVWNWFVNAGIDGVSDNPAVIAGIMGNIGVESGYNPFATNGKYHGLYQEDSVDMHNYVEGKIGAVNWGSSTDDAKKNSEAITAELEWLKDHSDFKEFVKKLDTPSNKSGVDGAKAYAELFLVQYERAVKGKEAIEDSGVYDYMQQLNGQAELYQDTDARRKEAKKVYEFAQKNGKSKSSKSTSSGSSGSGSSGGSAPSCNSCDQGSLNLNGTAVCLAWPYGTDTSRTDYPGGAASSAFTKAQNEVASGSTDTCAKRGASCDMFVSTVVRWSGYDKEYPLGDVDVQLDWAETHPDLWEVINDWDGSKSEVQAGDIILEKGSHTYMVVEDENEKLWVAAASHCDYFGQIKKWQTPKKSARIIRATGAWNSHSGVSVTGGVTTSSITGSKSVVGKGNGDINASALELAWPYGTPASSYESKPYWKFTKYFNTLGDDDTNACWGHGKACSVYVNAVLNYAGALKNREKTIDAGPLLKKLEKNKNWEEVKFGGRNPKKSELKPGDVLFGYNGSGLKHVALYVKTPKGGKLAEAQHCRNFGHVNDKTKFWNGHYSKVRVFRWKKNKSIENEASSCDVCEDASGAGLKAGGMTLAEAKEFMKAYNYAAMHDYYMKNNDVVFQGAYVNAVGCPYGVLNNCVAFSQWFINKYTTIGPKWQNTTDGVGMVLRLVNTKGLKLGKSDAPRPYAIFSNATGSDAGHTGVVLGVDNEKKKIIVGEASCSWKGDGLNYEPKASEYTFDYIKKNNWSFAYTDGVLSTKGALSDV